ncbi:MAG: GerMN domain-containing protein [Bacilli bacterium]|nr:GerMN domain-containing protein [Bacilli bacterium]
MLKRHAFQKIIKTTIALFILLLLCIFPKNDYQIPEEVIYINEPSMPIYVMDKNGYVARTMAIKNEKLEDIKYIIDILTINSVSSINLPIGFMGIIPENTKLLSYELKDGLLKLNFSKELLTLEQEKFEKAVESLIFSLCELENVDKIMLFVENQIINNIPEVLDKKYGINKTYDIDDIKGTNKTTIYYLSKNNDNYYYVPITKISNTSKEAVEVIVSELKSVPIYEANLISYLNASYELKDYQIMENAIHLSFNNLLLANLDEKDIEEKVKYTISLSLRDTYNIEDITITLN